MSGHSRLFHLEEIMSDPCFGYKGSFESFSASSKILSEDQSWLMKFKKAGGGGTCLHMFYMTIFTQKVFQSDVYLSYFGGLYK